MSTRDNRTTVTVRLTPRELSILYAFDGTPLSSIINKVRDAIKAEKLERQVKKDDTQEEWGVALLGVAFTYTSREAATLAMEYMDDDRETFLIPPWIMRAMPTDAGE